MKNRYTFHLCARPLVKPESKSDLRSRRGYVLTDVMVALIVMGLLLSAIGGFVRIAGLALSSAKEDMDYVHQSRKMAGELRYLERAEPGFVVQSDTLEYWVGHDHRGQMFRDPIGQFSMEDNLIYLQNSENVMMISPRRRRVDATCRYDLVGRRCI